MTTNRKPATPLPWRIVEERGNLPAIMKIAASGNLPAIFINGPRDELMVGGGIYARSIDKLYNRTGWWQDAAYIAHAANAYPLLVKALRELMLRCDGAEGVRADGSNIQTMAASALLHELGEAE